MVYLLVPEGAREKERPRDFRFDVTNFQHMRRFLSRAHVNNGLLASLSDLVTFASSIQQIDAVQGYIKEAGVARLRMWDLIFPFVIKYKFVFFALLVYLKMKSYLQKSFKIEEINIIIIHTQVVQLWQYYCLLLYYHIYR